MICRNIFYTVKAFRKVYVPSQVSIKIPPWQEVKLFHTASISCHKKKTQPFKPVSKNLKDKTPIKVWENMTAEELAAAMNIKFSELKAFYSMLVINPKTKIDSLSKYSYIAHKLGFKFEIINKAEEKVKSKFMFSQPPSKPENLVKRPPVVTIMGHVDHGKTTLLDSLRNTFVTQQEFGGITQHIGAFSVEVKPGQKITFIDTPGHAAFTAMRARGAEATDIVVLVIAADDGVMEQTVESIKIANEAQVKIIVAVNKIDKPTALSIDEIKNKLLIEGVQVEDQGGDIQLVPISALKKINLDLLTEVILLEADLMNLKGDPTGYVEGVIIESKKELAGIVATVIVKRGTLQKQKIIVAGLTFAKVRRMLDENGNDYEKAIPSTPVQVFGWKEVPVAGDKVLEVSTEKQAKALIHDREVEVKTEKQKSLEEIIKQKSMKEKEELYKNKELLMSVQRGKERRRAYFELKQKEIQQIKSEDKSEPELNVILKGDVYGSLEVLEELILSYDKPEECKLNLVDASVGNIKQSDLEMAELSDGIIYAFNVKIDQAVVDYVKEKNIKIHYHNIIYKLVEDLKKELDNRIPPVDQEKILGEAEVLENFLISVSSKKKVPVAGSKCTQGELIKDGLYKVIRNDEVIYTGKLIEMKLEKTVVKSISKGKECGLMLDSFPDKFIRGDKIICYELIKVQKKSSWNPGF